MSEKPVLPGQPKAKSLYRLFFAYGNNPRAELIFEHPAEELQSAINRGREHCAKMNYKFIRVEPYLVDLDAREKALLVEG